MDWAQVGTIVGINIALIGALATLIIWVVSKLDIDLKRLDTDLKGLSNRMDSINNRMDGHAQRIDQVYGIILEMLRDKK
jgi:hypothetical protein